MYDDDFNDKHNFTFRFDSNDGERHLEMNCNELYLSDILYRFKEFLNGCGYEFSGILEVVDYNSTLTEPSKSEQDYGSGYRLNEPPQHEPKWDFSNIPNNNWPFGALKSEPLPALTTVDLSGITVTDLSTLTTKPWGDWSGTGVNKYPTMAPLTSEQIQSWSTEMPGTLGSAKYNWSQYEGR